jgi:hypothetical protein
MTCDNCANYKPCPEPGIDPELVCRAIDAGEPVGLELSAADMFKAATMIAVRYKRHDGLIEFFDTDGLERSVGPNYRRILSARRVDCVDRATIRDEDTVTMRPVDVSDLAEWTGRWLVGKTVEGYIVTKHTPAQRKVRCYRAKKSWPSVKELDEFYKEETGWRSPFTRSWLSDGDAERAVRDGYLEAVYD